MSAGTWCRICAHCCQKTAEENFRRIVSEKGGKVLGVYLKNDIHVEIQCDKGHTWPVRPSSITSKGYWCPVCAECSPVAAKEKFEGIVNELGGKIVGIYVDTKTRVKVQCFEGHIWHASPNNTNTHRAWCPLCRRSKGEALLQWLANSSNLPSYPQYSLPEYPRRHYDLLVGTTSWIFAEHDGEHHFDQESYYSQKSDFKAARQRDIEKAKLVIEKYKCRMIRTTFNVLKCDREEVKELWDAALTMSDPLLYIDAADGVPFLSADAEIYDWLTSQVVIEKAKPLMEAAK